MASSKIVIPKPDVGPTDSWTAKANRTTDGPSWTTTIVYDITHDDGSKTIRTSKDVNGEIEVTDEAIPAPPDYVKPPTTPIAAPRDLPAGAGWAAKRSTEVNTRGVKTSTTTYSVDSAAGSYTQVEVKVGDGELLVTKTPPV